MTKKLSGLLSGLVDDPLVMATELCDLSDGGFKSVYTLYTFASSRSDDATCGVMYLY